MITRLHTPIKTKLAAGAAPCIITLPTAAIFFALPFFTDNFDSVDVASFLLAFVILGSAVWHFNDCFNPCRAHEAYVLSERTLAIVRRGHPTRYLKPKDFAGIRLFSYSFRLADGSTFRFQYAGNPRSRKEMAELFIKRWYDETLQDAFQDAEGYQPTSSQGMTTSILVCATAIALMAYGATSRHQDLVFWGLILIYIGMVTACIQGYLCKGLDVVALRADAAKCRPGLPTRRYANVLRIPRDKPRIVSLAAPYLLMALLLAGVVPLVDALERHFPPGPELTRMFTATYATAALCGIYLAWRFYQRIIRGDMFTAILISPRTLVILQYRRSPRFLRRADCVAWQPADDSIVLRDGEKFHLGVLPSIEDASAAFSALQRKWWSHVPHHAWKAQPGGPTSGRSAQVSLRKEDCAALSEQDLDACGGTSEPRAST